MSVISDSTNTVVANVTVGTTPYAPAYDSGKDEIFVTNHGSNSVSVISDSNNTVVANVTVGTTPYSAVYDSGKGEIFVTNAGDNTVSVISDASSVPEFSPEALILMMVMISCAAALALRKSRTLSSDETSSSRVFMNNQLSS